MKVKTKLTSGKCFFVTDKWLMSLRVKKWQESEQNKINKGEIYKPVIMQWMQKASKHDTMSVQLCK